MHCALRAPHFVIESIGWNVDGPKPSGKPDMPIQPNNVYMTTQVHRWGGAYGSSPLPTGPQTEGTRWSFVVLQYRIRLALASLTRTLGRARSSLRRWLCSVRRRSFSSDIDCLCGREFIVDDEDGGEDDL